MEISVDSIVGDMIKDIDDGAFIVIRNTAMILVERSSFGGRRTPFFMII